MRDAGAALRCGVVMAVLATTALFGVHRASSAEEPCSSLASSKVPSRLVDVVSYGLEDYQQNGGHLWLTGNVRNNCTEPRRVGISAVLRSTSDPASPPVAASATQYLELPATTTSGFSVALTGQLPSPMLWVWFRWTVAPLYNFVPLVCIDVGASQCLTIAPSLVDSAEELGTLASGAALLRAAAEAGVTIGLDTLGPDALSQYDPQSQKITIARRLETEGRWTRAALLAHELQRAAGDPAAAQQDEEQCLAGEAAALNEERALWMAFWQLPPPPATTETERILNALAAETWPAAPDRVQALASAYGHTCSTPASPTG